MPPPTKSSLEPRHRIRSWAAAAGIALLAIAAGPASSQPKGGALGKASIEKSTGVWVEGPGFDITYGKTYDVCAQRCLDNPKCVMIEFYLPEKKCNLYDTMRPRKPGGSSVVGIRR